MLLATSMVLTSVNVAPIFADEEISFGVEENFTTEDDASVDADFGDVVVEEDAVEEENTSADVAFDDVIEDDTVVEDVVTEDEAFVEEATPEEFVGNEDVLEAIQEASEGEAYADLTVTAVWKDALSYKYTGEKIAPTVTVTDKNGNDLTEGTDYTVSYYAADDNDKQPVEPVESGTYNAVLVLKDTDNYALSDPTKATYKFEITKADLEGKLLVDDSDKETAVATVGASVSLAVDFESEAAEVTGNDVTYIIKKDGKTFTTVDSTIGAENATFTPDAEAEYTVETVIDETTNYTYKVAPKKITVTASLTEVKIDKWTVISDGAEVKTTEENSYETTYTGSAFTMQATLVDANELEVEAKAVVKVDPETEDTSKVGSHKFVATLDEASAKLYKFDSKATTEFTLTVNAKTVAATPKAIDGVKYGSKPDFSKAEFNFTGEGLTATDKTTLTEALIKALTDEEATFVITADGEEKGSKFEELLPRTYEYNLKEAPTVENYKVTLNNGLVTIVKKDAGVYVAFDGKRGEEDAYSFTYGTKPAALSVGSDDISGELTGCTVVDKDGKEAKFDETTKVGVYTVTPKVTEDYEEKYNITATPATVTVKKAETEAIWAYRAGEGDWTIVSKPENGLSLDYNEDGYEITATSADTDLVLSPEETTITESATFTATAENYDVKNDTLKVTIKEDPEAGVITVSALAMGYISYGTSVANAESLKQVVGEDEEEIGNLYWNEDLIKVKGKDASEAEIAKVTEALKKGLTSLTYKVNGYTATSKAGEDYQIDFNTAKVEALGDALEELELSSKFEFELDIQGFVYVEKYVIETSAVHWADQNTVSLNKASDFWYGGETGPAVIDGANGTFIRPVVSTGYYDGLEDRLSNPDVGTQGTLHTTEQGEYVVYINDTSLSEADQANYTFATDKYGFYPYKSWFVLDDLSNTTAVYNSEQQFIKTPTDTGLEYQYYSVSEAKYIDGDPNGDNAGDGKWQSEIPGFVSAGTYKVYYQTRKAGSQEAFKGSNYALLVIAPKKITAKLTLDPVQVGSDVTDWELYIDRFTLTGIEAVDKKSDFFIKYPFYITLRDFFISKSGELKKVSDYDTITDTIGSYDVDFTKDANGNSVDNTGIIINDDRNYVVAVEKSTITVGKIDVRVKWYIDYDEETMTGNTTGSVAYDGDRHYVRAVIVSPTDWIGYKPDLVDYTERSQVGTYTAKLSNTALKQWNVVSGGTSYEWKITKKDVAVGVRLDGYSDKYNGKSYDNLLAYGAVDPTSTGKLGYKDLVFYEKSTANNWNTSSPITIDTDELSGTVTFTTNYRQYNNVDLTGSRLYITANVSGLTADNYNFVTPISRPLYVRPAYVKIVADNKSVGIDAKTTPKLTASFKDGKTGSGEAVAADHDYQAGVFTVEPTMNPYFPQELGAYPISVTAKDVYFKDAKRTYAQLLSEGTQTNFDFEFGNGVYTVGKGSFTISLSDNRVEYDGEAHTIKGIPGIDGNPDLPNGIEIYYVDAENAALKNYTFATVAQLFADFETNTKVVSTNKVYKKAVGAHVVYYHIYGPDYGYDEYGTHRISIISNTQWEAEELAKQIEAAVKEPLDAAKVKEARNAYDAASKAVQDDPAVGVAYKKLVAAEKKLAEEAAEQIKALLPADPSKAVDTDRDNYEKAKGIYDGLTDEAKALIPDTKKALDTAKAAIEADEAAKEKPFTDAVAALPKAADAKASDRAAVDAAKKIYDGLTAQEKEDVKAAKATLDAIDDAVKAAEGADKDADAKAAEAVTAMIEALPAPEDVTVDDENAIKNAVDAFDALTEAQQALVPEADQEKLAADVLALAAAMVKEAEDQAAADEIEALIDAIATSEPGDGKAAMEAAKAAYDAATADVQAKVDKGHKEVLDEAIECYKKDTTFQAGRGVYRVLSNGDVTYVKPLYPEDTYFQVPNDVVCPEGFPFKVVKVSVNAFKGCTNVTKIWMGKNIVTIGKYAFKGATNLRTLIVRTQAIDVTEKIENAFAGMAANRNGKVNVQIWEKMLSKYEPMFRGAGKLPAKAYFTTIG